jgi:hypothetical protein
MKIFIILFFFIVNLTYSQALKISIEEQENWAQWRGPWATGIANDGNPPIEWSEEKNINWKVEIPGKGHATPIVWGDQIFLSTAIPTDKTAIINQDEKNEGRSGSRGVNTDKIHEFSLLSLEKNTGKLLWHRILRQEYPTDGTHEIGSWASNSPVTDGKYIYAYFGSRGIYCLDMQGNLKWERDLGKMEKLRSFGEGSSPVLYKNKLILVRDHEGQSAIIVMDKNNGKDVWMKNRDEASSWSTELLAIDLLKAKGNIDDSDAVVWNYDDYTPYTPSPLLMGDLLYFLRENKGRLSCLNAKDGNENYTNERLEGLGNLFTSPVGINGRIYLLGQKGLTYVVKHGPKIEVLAKNQLDDNFVASPVIIGDTIYLRGYKNLYSIK